MENLSIRDIINNVKDELQRATERIKEIGEVQTETVTDDDILIDDMTCSLDRMEDLMERIEFALICAVCAGCENAKINFEHACENSEWREKYLNIASEIKLEYEDNFVNFEWAYNTASDLVKMLFQPKKNAKTEDITYEERVDTLETVEAGLKSQASQSNLPEGYKWEHFKDGSGSITGPDNKSYFCYDLQPYANVAAVEYQKDSSSPWDVYWDGFEAFKRYAETAIRKDVESRTSIFSGISMKSNCGGETYYRMSIKANKLPMWMYLKAKEMDKNINYLSNSDEQVFEIEGYISSIDDKSNSLKLVYYWDDYETITELDAEYHKHIYEAFEQFAFKYGDKLPDNSELCLGDSEYWDKIPEVLKKEWNEHK